MGDIHHVPGGNTLAALLLCGFLGLMGQGVRAAVGLKSSNSIQSVPSTQATFSAAYFALSLMIGFIAGVVAGFALGLQNFLQVDLSDPKILLGIAAAGYAGADFIENSLSIVIPATGSQTVLPQQTDYRATFSTLPLPSPAPTPDPSAALKAGLSVVAPKVNQSIWLSPLTSAFKKYDVSNNRRIAVAIGQFLVEAGSAFQEVAENLNYTHAERIAEVFPNEFPTPDSAQAFVGNPQALANRVYANKLGNGDEQSGDGYNFRGRGLIQLTARSEYAEFGSTIGKTAEDAAAYCETSEGAAMSGCWYLSSRGCLPLADAWQISQVTKKVNGSAMLGDSQRISYATNMLKQLGG